MIAKTIASSRGAAVMFSLSSAAMLWAAGMVPASADPLFNQTNLVSDIPGLAKITDPSLVNSWGITESSTSSILDLRQRHRPFDTLLGSGRHPAGHEGSADRND